MELAVQDGTLSLQAELEPLRNLERTYRTTSMDETGQRRRGRKAPCSAGLCIRHGRLDEVLLVCGMKWLALACGQSAGVPKIDFVFARAPDSSAAARSQVHLHDKFVGSHEFGVIHELRINE